MKDEERWELRKESFRVLFTTMVQLCKDDDELIEMCAELETMIDIVKRDINVRHIVETASVERVGVEKR